MELIVGAMDDKKGFTLRDPALLHPKTGFKKGVGAASSSELLKDFFARKRK
jgi:hypothetical protein